MLKKCREQKNTQNLTALELSTSCRRFECCASFSQSRGLSSLDHKSSAPAELLGLVEPAGSYITHAEFPPFLPRETILHNSSTFFPPSACKPAEFEYKSEQEVGWLHAASVNSRDKLFKSEVLETNSIITVQLNCRKKSFLFCAPGPAAAEPTGGSGQSVHTGMNTGKAAKWGRYTLNTATLRRILYFVYEGQ